MSAGCEDSSISLYLSVTLWVFIGKGIPNYGSILLFVKPTKCNFITMHMGQHQPYPSEDSFKQAYRDMTLEEAEKLYDKLAKELIEKIIDEYSVKSSIPFLHVSNLKN